MHCFGAKARRCDTLRPVSTVTVAVVITLLLAQCGAGPGTSLSIGLPIQQREAAAHSDSAGVHGTFTQWLDIGLSVAASRNLDRPQHAGHLPRASASGTHTPTRRAFGPYLNPTLPKLGADGYLRRSLRCQPASPPC